MLTITTADPSYNDIVVAIELLNEPKGWVLNEGDLRQFYREGDIVVFEMSVISS